MSNANLSMFQYIVKILSRKSASKYSTEQLMKDLFRHADDCKSFFEVQHPGRIDHLTGELGSYLMNKTDEKSKNEINCQKIMDEIQSLVNTDLLQLPVRSELDDLKLVEFIEKEHQDLIVRALDFIYHRDEYIAHAMHSLLVLFKCHTSLPQAEINPLKIFRDIIVITHDLNIRYLRGSIFADLKAFMIGQEQILVGSFLEQYNRIYRLSEDNLFKRSFIYSIEMFKKGLDILSYEKTLDNVDSTLKGLTTEPDDPVDHEAIERCMDTAIWLIRPHHVVSREPTTSFKASYNHVYGFGKTAILDGTETFEDRPKVQEKISRMREKLLTQDHTKLINDDDFRQQTSTIQVHVGDQGPATVTTEWVPLIGKRARIKVLQEPNKNRFLTIQCWAYQNLLNDLQKSMLQDWFSLDISTHTGPDVFAFMSRQTHYDHPIHGWESVDYSAATDKLKPWATFTYMKKYLEVMGIADEYWPAVSQAIGPREFDLKHFTIQHPSLKRFENACSRHFDEYVAQRDGKRIARSVAYQRFIRKYGKFALQKNGQMMGNPLSFACLCGLNLVTWIMTLEREYNCVFLVDRERDLVQILKDKRTITCNRRLFRLRHLGPIIINGDDGLFPILSVGDYGTYRKHKECAGDIGLVINDLKSKPILYQGYKTIDDRSYTQYSWFNINSIQFFITSTFRREITLDGRFFSRIVSNELTDIGYLNLSLFFGRNVKQDKESHDSQSIGDQYRDLIDRMITEKIAIQTSESFFYEHAELIRRGIRMKVFDPKERVEYRVQDSLKLYLPVKLKGLNMYQHIQSVDFPVLLSRFDDIVYKIVESLSSQFDPDRSERLFLRTRAELLDQDVCGLPVPSETNSEACAYAIKRWMNHLACTRKVVVNGPGLSISEIFDILTRAYARVTRELQCWNMEFTKFEKLMPPLLEDIYYSRLATNESLRSTKDILNQVYPAYERHLTRVIEGIEYEFYSFDDLFPPIEDILTIEITEKELEYEMLHYGLILEDEDSSDEEFLLDNQSD